MSSDTSRDTGSFVAPRLYRSRTNRMIGGVAGGLAEHLGVDPALIRIAFVLMLVTGPGFLIYIIALIVIPEAPEGYVPPPPSSRSGGEGIRLLVGGLLIAIGGFLLLDRIVPWLDKLIVPGAIIAIGVAVLVYGMRR